MTRRMRSYLSGRAALAGRHGLAGRPFALAAPARLLAAPAPDRWRLCAARGGARPSRAGAARPAGLGFRGANLTIPHKEPALALVDRVTPAAARIGAVNTVVVEPDGLLGDNTDGYGFMASLAAGAPGWRAADGPAVLLGAGGAARAIAVALIDAGAPELRLVNRTPARAETLARSSPTRRAGAAPPWPCCPGRTARGAGRRRAAGQHHQPRHDRAAAAGARSRRRCRAAALVTDVVYSPLETGAARGRRGRAATPWSTASACCCIRRGPAFAPGSASIPRSTEALRASGAGGARREMFVLGLTGSIAMGKSTASARLPQLRHAGVRFGCRGAPRCSRRAAPRSRRSIAAFPGCLDAAGGVDRAALGRQVFDDPAALARLEAIVHPLVRAAQRRFLARCAPTAGRWWCSTSRCSTRPAASGWSTRSRWSARRRSCRRSACCSGRA